MLESVKQRRKKIDMATSLGLDQDSQRSKWYKTHFLGLSTSSRLIHQNEVRANFKRERQGFGFTGIEVFEKSINARPIPQLLNLDEGKFSDIYPDLIFRREFQLIPHKRRNQHFLEQDTRIRSFST